MTFLCGDCIWTICENEQRHSCCPIAKQSWFARVFVRLRKGHIAVIESEEKTCAVVFMADSSGSTAIVVETRDVSALVEPFVDLAKLFDSKSLLPRHGRGGDDGRPDLISAYLNWAVPLDFPGTPEICPNEWFSPWLYSHLTPGFRCRSSPEPLHANPLVDWLLREYETFPGASRAIVVYVTREDLGRAWFCVEDWIRHMPDDTCVEMHFCREEWGNSETVPVGFRPFLERGCRAKWYSSLETKTMQPVPFSKSPWLHDVRQCWRTDADVAREGIQWSSSWTSGGMQCWHAFPHGVYGRIGVMTHYNGFFLGTKWEYHPRAFQALVAHREPSFQMLRYKIPVRRWLLEYGRFFDCVASFWDDIPGTFSVVVPGATGLWLAARDAKKPEELAFGVGFLFSCGQMSLPRLPAPDSVEYKAVLEDPPTPDEGMYYARRCVWEEQDRITIPKAFYTTFSRGKKKLSESMQERSLPTDSKKWVFEHMFHIAVENTVERNYMSEKLFDCFVGNVVPIYLGCPNVGDYFDLRGILVADSVEDIVRICNTVTHETYASMRPYMDENKKRMYHLFGTWARSVKEWKDTIHVAN